MPSLPGTRRSRLARPGLAMLALLLASGRPAPCRAAPASAREQLEAIDRAAQASADAHLEIQVAATDQRGTTTHRELELWQKGARRRLVRITAPPRLAGVGLLVDGDNVHLYLPAYGRPRRVVGQALGGAFGGTGFSMEDLALLRFEDDYTAELVDSPIPDQIELRLSPLDPEAHAHAALLLRARRADHLVTRIDHLDESGAVTRRVTFSDFRAEQGRTLAHRLVVDDLERGRHAEALIRGVELDAGIDDQQFTLSALARD